MRWLTAFISIGRFTDYPIQQKTENYVEEFCNC